MPRVLISDKLESPGLDLLRQAGIELDERHGLTGAALQEALRAADGVIVRSGTRVTAELLEDPGHLRAVVRPGVGVDPFLAPDRAAQLGIESVAGLEQLLPRCDFLTVHTPLTDETRDLVGARELALLPRGARVLNCARGGIINETALADALRSGH